MSLRAVFARNRDVNLSSLRSCERLFPGSRRCGCRYDDDIRGNLGSRLNSRICLCVRSTPTVHMGASVFFVQVTVDHRVRAQLMAVMSVIRTGMNSSHIYTDVCPKSDAHPKLKFCNTLLHIPKWGVVSGFIGFSV